ncbi:hypothethical protein (plasmid) [Ralstonia solanacearum CMR15]|nr:hypothethical protein [Ralstonia solanacearum CMR15]
MFSAESTLPTAHHSVDNWVTERPVTEPGEFSGKCRKRKDDGCGRRSHHIAQHGSLAGIASHRYLF